MPPSPPLIDDLSFSDLSLLTSPGPSFYRSVRPLPAGGFESDSLAQSSPVSHAGADSQTGSDNTRRLDRGKEGSLRLLQGLKGEKDKLSSEKNGGPPVSGRQRNAGGQRRTSLFVTSAIPKCGQQSLHEDQIRDEVEDHDRSMGGSLGHLNQDDLLPLARTASQPLYPQTSTSASATGPQTRDERERPLSQVESASHNESKDQVQRQLDELQRMNSTFEAYERMLQGSAGQIELFSHRLSCTSELLSSYMDLLVRSSDHQSFLLSPQWHGQTSDYEQHLSEMAKLEEELERRRRKREEDEALAAAKTEAQGRQGPSSKPTAMTTSVRGRGALAAKSSSAVRELSHSSNNQRGRAPPQGYSSRGRGASMTGQASGSQKDLRGGIRGGTIRRGTSRPAG